MNKKFLYGLFKIAIAVLVGAAIGWIDAALMVRRWHRRITAMEWYNTVPDSMKYSADTTARERLKHGRDDVR